MHILLSTFRFPPLSSPEALRLGRFAGHFVSFGGRVTVVAGSLDDYRHGFPSPRGLDDALLESLPPEVRIFRTKAVRPGWAVRSLDRMRLGRLHRLWYRPDTTIRWRKAAVRLAKAVCRGDPVDCIYTSSNPLSNHFVGLDLARALGKPWIAEFQDPWTESPFGHWESILHFHYERRLQAKILRKASKVVMNTAVARQQLLEAFPWVESGKVEVVENSFEPRRFDARKRRVNRGSNGTLTITHVGTMYGVSPTLRPNGRRWRRNKLKNLAGRFRRFLNEFGRYEPTPTDFLGRSPWYICRALEQLVSQQPHLRNSIKLVLVGGFPTVPDASSALGRMVDDLGLAGMVDYFGEVPHQCALEFMEAAEVLLANQIYSLDGRPCPCVAAKTYEYLAMRKPILALVPSGDMRDFLLQSGLATVAAPNDVTEIAQKILELYQEHMNGGIRRTPNTGFIEQFRSDRLARRVWDLFGQVAGCSPGNEDAGRDQATGLNRRQ